MRKRKLTRHVAVMISEETYRLLLDVTDDLEISKSEYVRMVLEEALKGAKDGDTDTCE